MQNSYTHTLMSFKQLQQTFLRASDKKQFLHLVFALLYFGVSRSPTGKKNKLRVYYLSWLRNKILHNDPEVEKKQGWTTVGDLEGCVHYKVGTFITKGHVAFKSLGRFHCIYEHKYS